MTRTLLGERTIYLSFILNTIFFFFNKFRILEEASDTSHNSLGHTCVMCSSSKSRQLTVAGLCPQGPHSWVGRQTWITD